MYLAVFKHTLFKTQLLIPEVLKIREFEFLAHFKSANMYCFVTTAGYPHYSKCGTTYAQLAYFCNLCIHC